MRFTIVTFYRYGQKFLAYIDAETSFSAYQKAKRIEKSNKPCAWRGISWNILEMSPHRNPHKTDNIKTQTRRAFRQKLKQFGGEEIISESSIRKVSNRTWKARARNGVVVFD